MSIKIDLMPRYVALQRNFRRWLMGAAAVLTLVAAALSLIYVKGQNDLAVMKSQLAEATEVAALTTTAQTAQGKAAAEALPLESFVQFVVNAGQTGAQRAALIDLVKRYISPNAVISQIDMSDGRTAKITATLRTPDDYARFLLDLRRGSASQGGALFAEDPRSFAVLPQGPLPGAGFSRFALPRRTTQPVVVTYPITMVVVGTLKDPVIVPAEPGGAATATTAIGGPPSSFPGAPPPGVGGPPGGVSAPPSGPPTGPPS